MNYTIEFLSQEWIRNTFFVLIVIIFFLLLGKFNNYKSNQVIAKSISLIVFILTITSQIEYIINDKWIIQEHLLLHLCAISQLIASLIFILPKRNFFFEFLFYCGILGGLQAILTPQLNYYDGSLFEYIEYYVTHTIIILLPLFLYFNLNMKLSKYSWFRIFISLNVLMIIIMPLNFMLESNYMYLNSPPEVDNPLIIGEWPIYLLFLEIFTITLFYLFFKLINPKLK
ncbi:MAG: TIGR02206 family membrane protein [Flavobacteriaceae bacterium]|nr:TIGR02206 family membrane protein [Flavobacteriaceae bacterium]